MKLIGGKDYYDGAGWGIDEEIVFVRNPKELKDVPFNSSYFGNNTGFCVVAGKFYPFVEFSHRAERDFVWKSEFIYDSRKLPTKIGRYSKRELEFFLNSSEHYERKYRSWLIENKIATATFQVRFNQKEFVANTSKLYEFGLQKVLHPYEAYTAIYDWISGVLPAGANPMITLSDKSKILKAGFDLKQSFRHRK